MVKQIQFKNFNPQHKNNRYFVVFEENTYVFVVKWNDYCDCAFLSIYDYNNEPIISSRALTNNCIIRHNKLPHVFYFLQKNGETYEPTIKNIADEFVLAYEYNEGE